MNDSYWMHTVKDSVSWAGDKHIESTKYDADGNWISRSGVTLPESEIPALIAALRLHMDSVSA